MRWLDNYLHRWHATEHSNVDYMKLMDALKEVDRLKKQNYALGEEVKKLNLQLEIKQMNDFLGR